MVTSPLQFLCFRLLMLQRYLLRCIIRDIRKRRLRSNIIILHISFQHLGTLPKEASGNVSILTTKENLYNASLKEITKIEIIYPGFLEQLRPESHEEAITSCMYSWKSHRQHEKNIRDIRKYTNSFFGFVSKRIEGLDYEYHVCEICGSTITERPKTPCEICNLPLYHYKKIIRPV